MFLSDFVYYIFCIFVFVFVVGFLVVFVFVSYAFQFSFVFLIVELLFAGSFLKRNNFFLRIVFSFFPFSLNFLFIFTRLLLYVCVRFFFLVGRVEKEIIIIEIVYRKVAAFNDTRSMQEVLFLFFKFLLLLVGRLVGWFIFLSVFRFYSLPIQKCNFCFSNI